MKKDKPERNCRVSWRNSKSLAARWLSNLMIFRNQKLIFEYLLMYKSDMTNYFGIFNYNIIFKDLL